jgi:DNA-binding NarL/FixJ family response regulator
MTERPSHMTKPSILLAAAQPLFREGLQTVLSAHGFSVVAEATDARSAIAAAAEHRPSGCVLDENLPGGGILTVRRITERSPETGVVVLTSELSAETVLAAVRAGANGIVSATTTGNGLIRAVASVLDGQASIPRKAIADLIRECRNDNAPRVSLDDRSLALTPRELEVLELLHEDLTTGQIARALTVSQVTVRRHLGAIVAKAERRGQPRAESGNGRSGLLRLVRVA